HRDHVGHDAVEIGGERVADAAEAALHLIEDQLRANLVAAPAQRLEVRFTEVDRARETLYRLHDHRSRAVGDVGGDGRDIAARHEADIERLAREAIPAVGAPGDRA